MNVVFEIGVGDVSLVPNVKTSRMIAGQCGPTLCQSKSNDPDQLNPILI
jgi:hypothetical protein